MALEASTQKDIPNIAEKNLVEGPTRFQKSLFRGGGRSDTITGGEPPGNIDSVSSSLLLPLDKPSSPQIRQWMIESQRTVNRVVTDWQQGLVDSSLIVSKLLEDLTQFISDLDKDAAPVSILTSKLKNNSGSYESKISVYLHVILVTINKVTRSVEGKKQRKLISIAEREKFLNILSQFTYLAEDALKFLHAHEKYLVPVFRRVISMRNDFFEFLRSVNAEPLGRIIPLLSVVSLERIRMREDAAWMERLCLEHLVRQKEEFFSYLEVQVGSRDYTFLVDNPEDHPSRPSEESSTTMERLEFVEILLKQLGICIGSSSRGCKERHRQLFDLCSRLWKNFHILCKTLDMESRRLRLKPENCSKSLKTSLCELEVKFHQAEKLLDEIPDHLRRIVGICDHCCRQLITGLGEEAHDMLEQWSSPVEDISEEYFKSKRNFFQGCFPFLWSVILKVFINLSRNSRGSDNSSISADAKFNEFWAQVSVEMEQFHKEIKAKELESDYRIILTIPIAAHSTIGDREDLRASPLSHRLVKYLRFNKRKPDILHGDGGENQPSARNVSQNDILSDQK